MADASHVAECDYLGIVSANDVPNKLEISGFHTSNSEFVDAPLIEELKLALECRLVSYDDDSCRLVGEIVNVCADEDILGANGKIAVQKLDPITFDPVANEYIRLGDTVGKAFGEGLKIKKS